MSHLKYDSYAGAGQWLHDHLGYSQAVRVGDRIEISGQGGWELNENGDGPSFPSDLKAEIEKAFENVDRTLKSIGGKGWSQVYRVNSYHTNLEQTEEVTGAMSAAFARWMPDHKPIWTEVGVKRLGAPDMRVEIEVVAHDPEGAKSAH
ncbi:endoribonuclease l-PSP domain-containing protein [Sarocladium implicatum]|nr:endoribonuclease l-PSP domain-containing protein [Sarocladium implicatum]